MHESEPNAERVSPADALVDAEAEAAARSDSALVAYQAKWERRVAALQRRYPERWRVPGLSEDEVRAAVTLRLIELLRGDAADRAPYARPEKEWGLCVAEQHVRQLRKSFRLDAEVMDLREVSLPERGPTEEERWLKREADACRLLAAESARDQLSRPQRQWLAAMKLAAAGGAFFQSSSEPNLSAASRVLGKNRSSAQRAFRQLQERFQSELDKQR